MKKRLGVEFLFMSTLVSLTACGGPTGQEAKLVGRWQTTEMLARATVEYHADHNLTLWAATLFGSVNATGTWRIEGDEIHTEIQNTTTSTVC